MDVIKFILALTYLISTGQIKQFVKPEQMVDIIYNKIFIGEAYISGYVYIEPFNTDWSVPYLYIELPANPNHVEFVAISNLANTKYNAVFDSNYKTYIPDSEEDSKYFFSPFATPTQVGFKYKIENPPKEPQIGITIFDYRIYDVDYSVNGIPRPYSEEEYNTAMEQIKKDQEITDRTLVNINQDNTILGAKELCVFKLQDLDMSIVLSKYFSHGFEYAGDVYVVDFIIDGKVYKTYEKYNWDGPY